MKNGIIAAMILVFSAGVYAQEPEKKDTTKTVKRVTNGTIGKKIEPRKIEPVKKPN